MFFKIIEIIRSIARIRYQSFLVFFTNCFNKLFEYFVSCRFQIPKIGRKKFIITIFHENFGNFILFFFFSIMLGFQLCIPGFAVISFYIFIKNVAYMCFFLYSVLSFVFNFFLFHLKFGLLLFFGFVLLILWCVTKISFFVYSFFGALFRLWTYLLWGSSPYFYEGTLYSYSLSPRKSFGLEFFSESAIDLSFIDKGVRGDIEERGHISEFFNFVVNFDSPISVLYNFWLIFGNFSGVGFVMFVGIIFAVIGSVFYGVFVFLFNSIFNSVVYMTYLFIDVILFFNRFYSIRISPEVSQTLVTNVFESILSNVGYFIKLNFFLYTIVAIIVWVFTKFGYRMPRFAMFLRSYIFNTKNSEIFFSSALIMDWIFLLILRLKYSIYFIGIRLYQLLRKIWNVDWIDVEVERDEWFDEEIFGDDGAINFMTNLRYLHYEPTFMDLNEWLKIYDREKNF